MWLSFMPRKLRNGSGSVDLASEVLVMLVLMRLVLGLSVPWSVVSLVALVGIV